MKKRLFGIIFLTSILLCAFSFTSDVNASVCEGFELVTIQADEPIIADHTVCDYIRLDLINDSAINTTKETLHIAYQHTSHGSQISSGMTGLPAFKEGLGGSEGLYDYNNGGTDGALDFHDYFGSGDLGSSDWADQTRSYLDTPGNEDVNVIMWSWCGQVTGSSEAYIQDYLDDMNSLELEYPNVAFVYMTGHVNGDGLDGSTHIRNEQIRDYVKDNNKILFDFADIESYDPDGAYFGDKNVTDGCCYDFDGDGTTEYTGDPETPLDGDKNWAQDWQNSHTVDVDWYDCGAAHSESLNGNLKAYAAWWLWVILSGWNSSGIVIPPPTTTPTLPFSAASIVIISLALMTMPIVYNIIKRLK